MKPIRRALSVASQFGIDPVRGIRTLQGVVPFFRDLRAYKRASRTGGLPIAAYYPCFSNRFQKAGQVDAHYFHQDLWAARKVYVANPVRHVDVGSSIAGFVAHLLTFRAVEIVDVRPFPKTIAGLSVTVGDATTMANFADNSLESVSSLHAAEHFGLGRYGDPIDPQGHVRFMRSLSRVLSPGGRLYLSVPSGTERLYFNAHRVLAPSTVLQSVNLPLVSFSCVLDSGEMLEDCDPSRVSAESYGCGLYEFTKE